MPPKSHLRLSDLAPVAAAALSAIALAAATANAVAAAETAYLAVLLAGLLACATAVRGGASGVVLLGALGTTLALWTVPAGGSRGAVAIALATAILAWATYQRLSEIEDAPLGLDLAVPLAVGTQLLWSSRSLLRLEPIGPVVLDLILLPLVAASAIAALAGRRGTDRALAAAAVVFLIGGGWTLRSTVILVALAAAQVASDPASGRALGRRRLTAALALIGALAVLATSSERLALLTLLAATVLYASHRPLVHFAAGGAAAAALLVAPQPWATSISHAAWLPLLLPALALRPATRLAPPLLIALAGARQLPGLDGLLPGLAVLALAPSEGDRAASLERPWLGVLTFASLLTAAYPWFHQEPVVTTLAWLGLQVSWPSALLLALLFTLTTWLGRPPHRRRSAPLLPVAALLLLVVVRSLAGEPGNRSVRVGPAVLDAQQRARFYRLPPGCAPRHLTLDSYLSNAPATADRAPAFVRLVREGLPPVDLHLEVGVETADWAAGRPDLRARTQPALAPWMSWPAPGRSFYAQRYRTRLEPADRSLAHRVGIVLTRHAGADLTLSVLDLEIGC